MTLKFWNGMTIAAIAALAGLLLFDLFAPMPQTAAQNRLAAEKRLRDQSYALEQEAAEIRKAIDSKVWRDAPDVVGAKALAQATQMAKQHGLKLTAFRPQKPADEGELTRLAYVMTLEGPYPGLQGMVRDLETDERRLSVHLVQAASADEASDLVNATVGISAYVEKKKATPAKEPTKNAQA